MTDTTERRAGSAADWNTERMQVGWASLGPSTMGLAVDPGLPPRGALLSYTSISFPSAPPPTPQSDKAAARAYIFFCVCESHTYTLYT